MRERRYDATSHTNRVCHCSGAGRMQRTQSAHEGARGTVELLILQLATRAMSSIWITFVYGQPDPIVFDASADLNFCLRFLK